MTTATKPVMYETVHEVGKVYVLTQEYGRGTVYRVTGHVTCGTVAAHILLGAKDFVGMSGHHVDGWIGERCELSRAKEYTGDPIEVSTNWGC